VLSNVPLLPLFILTLSLRLRRVPYVFWHQDVYSEATGSLPEIGWARWDRSSAGSRGTQSVR